MPFRWKKKLKKEEKTFKKYHFLSWHLFSVEEFEKIRKEQHKQKSSQSFFVKIDRADICYRVFICYTFFHST